jgi:cation diffusion facilitator CzcD-associated flavoprotein CzcO
MRDVAVVVVGAGQAGLSSAFHLRRLGYEPGRDFVVLDGAQRPGGAWQFRWPTLTYGKVHGMHALPGMELTGADPQRRSSEVIGEYFAAYEDTFALAVRRPVHVRAVREGRNGRLDVETSDGTWSARAVINATGTWNRPFWPRYPGQHSFRGAQLHTAQYPGPHSGLFTGKRVVVIGGGTSAVQHLLEVSEVAAETAWVTRREPVFRDGPFAEDQGRAAVALVAERVQRGLPPGSVVSVTGLPMTEAMAGARERGGAAAAADVRADRPGGCRVGRRPQHGSRHPAVGDGLPACHRSSGPAEAARERRRHPYGRYARGGRSAYSSGRLRGVRQHHRGQPRGAYGGARRPAAAGGHAARLNAAPSGGS